ncbi:MAG: hypothetical protein HY906_10560, partial [Deltaproteobacteria bacterium]|nr:hypothetical protein [Deltaproteobacteria bacterium]
MRRHAWLPLLLVLALAACGPTNDEEDLGDGGTHPDGFTGGGDGGGGDGPIDQPPPDNCSDAAKLVYVVDEDGRFSSFDPKTTPPTFHDITANLNCPAQVILGIKATPFSMSVDRNAVAWVLYNSGELFRVDTSNGSCTATSFVKNQQGFLLMGMGFVANAQGSTLDTLYVAGGNGPGTGTGARLGTIDMNTLTVTAGQQLTGWPELTGTGLAELWGFYPDTTPPKVAKIDKTSGAETVLAQLPSLQGDPGAWAFAFWGGDFWIFLMRQLVDTDTTVYRVKGSDGSMTVA